MAQVVTQKIPYQDKYDLCKKCARWGEGFLLAAGALSLLFMLPFFAGVPDWLVKSLGVVNILLILGQFALLTVSEVYLYPEAETERIKGLFDDALHLHLLDKPLEGYYSNGYLPCGVRKMLVDSFENSLFTYNIARKMMPKLILKNTAFFTLFFVVAIFGLPTNGLISLFQVFVSQAFLLILFRHLYFTRCVRAAYNGFLLAFSDASIPDAYALYAMITYEKALSGYASLLDSKVYSHLNNRLSREWEEIKGRYHFEQEQPPV